MGKRVGTNKGSKMEEYLRNYFLDAGYYVARGVPFVYDEFNVTDIDLWLYGRASSVSREITIVDIKNRRRTPQAIERIFWIQGLMQATNATRAVVATTDKRQAVKDFGKERGVLVLDGTFLKKISKNYDLGNERLNEEEFKSMIDEYTLSKLDDDWIRRISSCKSLLSKQLSFDRCNEWLLHAHFFAEQSITKPKKREIALRCLYLVCSFVAIAIDFILKELSFLDQPERITMLKDGFTYGSKSSSEFKKVINLAMGLVEQHALDGTKISNQVRSSIESQLSLLNAIILGEFFSKTDVSKRLFDVAKELEYLAMKRSFSSHTDASTELRAMLLCFLDFWGIDRVIFSEKEKIKNK